MRFILPAAGEDERVTSVEAVRRVALSLPRTTEHLIRDQVKFRVGSLVYVAFSRDETVMGFGFPKDERPLLVDSDPERFLLPRASDLRYNWVCGYVDKLADDEMRELVTDAWAMCVPKKVAAEYFQRFTAS
jgi:hypothetical protein